MDFWGNVSTTIDLRREMHHVLFGGVGVVPIGRQVILRQFTDDHCQECWDAIQGGSNRFNCPYCAGEGYLFRERLVTMAVFAGVAPVYKPSILATGQYPMSKFGYIDPDRHTAYCEWNTYLNYERYTQPLTKKPDRLYTLKVDENGNTISPQVRASKWKVLSVTPIHGDNGRVEFFELGLEHEITT